MRAIAVTTPVNADQLVPIEVPTPVAGPEDVLIDVYATALNRADLLQRRGKYPPPAGESNVLGLECAGIVAQVGQAVKSLKVGDRVMTLLGSGGYAEQVVCHHAMAIPVPSHLTLVEAAAIPEAFLTAREALFTLGRLSPQSRLLVHAAAGGVGSAAVQLAKACGATVFATASAQKLERVRALGADYVIDYGSESFADVIAERSERRGVDVIIDFVGSSYFEQHMKCLGVGGRMVVVGVMGGPTVTLNLGSLLFKRHQILGLVMRSRSLSDKIAITAAFIRESLPQFALGQLKPIVDSVFDFDAAGKAHERMENNLNTGKIVLQLRKE
ncbi:MAG TPA: NAD(P)H-quinone oxidoreductase [Polyangiaceae bacterium]